MFLLSKEELWMSDGSMDFEEETDENFSEGKSPSIAKVPFRVTFTVTYVRHL